MDEIESDIRRLSLFVVSSIESDQYLDAETRETLKSTSNPDMNFVDASLVHFVWHCIINRDLIDRSTRDEFLERTAQTISATACGSQDAGLMMELQRAFRAFLDALTEPSSSYPEVEAVRANLAKKYVA